MKLAASVVYQESWKSAFNPVVGDGAKMVYAGYGGTLQQRLHVIKREAVQEDPGLDSFFSHYEAVSELFEKSGGQTSLYYSHPKGLFSALEADRENMGILWAYMHGDARGAFLGPEYMGEKIGNKLVFFFKEDGMIFAGDFRLRLVDFRQPGKYVLARRPLVVLLACETGAAALGGTSGPELAEELIQLGARGVVISESEIPVAAASPFGVHLMDALAEGYSPPEAVLLARQKLFERNKSLFGLIVGYVGVQPSL